MDPTQLVVLSQTCSIQENSNSPSPPPCKRRLFTSHPWALVMVGHQGGWGWRTKVLGKRGRKAMTAFTPIGQQGAVQAVFPGKHGAPPLPPAPDGGQPDTQQYDLIRVFYTRWDGSPWYKVERHFRHATWPRCARSRPVPTLASCGCRCSTCGYRETASFRR